MKFSRWIPVDSGLLPDEMEDVQVTFIGHNDKKPHCEAFAYMNDRKWHWSLDDEEVKVEITAWRSKCEPYDGVDSIITETIDADVYVHVLVGSLQKACSKLMFKGIKYDTHKGGPLLIKKEDLKKGLQILEDAGIKVIL